MTDDRGVVPGELTVAGRVRRFALRLPQPRPSGEIPLVIVLHGNHPDATGQMMRDWTTFDEQADALGFAVAYPDGRRRLLGRRPRRHAADEAGVDDVAFLRALIACRPNGPARWPTAPWWRACPTERSWPTGWRSTRATRWPCWRRRGRAARQPARRAARPRRVGDTDSRRGRPGLPDRGRLLTAPRPGRGTARPDAVAGRDGRSSGAPSIAARPAPATRAPPSSRAGTRQKAA